MKFEYTPELAKELKEKFNLDVEKELITILSEEIENEYKRIADEQSRN